MASRKSVSAIIRTSVKNSEDSLRKIAWSAGLDAGNLSRFVQGKRGMGIDALDRLCRTLGLTLTLFEAKKPRKKR